MFTAIEGPKNDPITVEPKKGSNLSDCLNDCIKLAGVLNCKILLLFNGEQYVSNKETWVKSK